MLLETATQNFNENQLKPGTYSFFLRLFRIKTNSQPEIVQSRQPTSLIHCSTPKAPILKALLCKLGFGWEQLHHVTSCHLCHLIQKHSPATATPWWKFSSWPSPTKPRNGFDTCLWDWWCIKLLWNPGLLKAKRSQRLRPRCVEMMDPGSSC